MGSTCHLLYIFTSLTTCFRKRLRFRDKTLHDGLEVISRLNLQATATGLKPLGLLKTLIVRPEYDRNIPHRSLQQIVNAYAKATADIGNISIAINARQKTEAIDNQYFCIAYVFLFRISIAHHFTTSQKLLYLGKMFLGNDMRGNDEFPVFMLIEIGDKDILIRLP